MTNTRVRTVMFESANVAVFLNLTETVLSTAENTLIAQWLFDAPVNDTPITPSTVLSDSVNDTPSVAPDAMDATVSRWST